jgi:hypothetical protein
MNLRPSHRPCPSMPVRVRPAVSPSPGGRGGLGAGRAWDQPRGGQGVRSEPRQGLSAVARGDQPRASATATVATTTATVATAAPSTRPPPTPA